MAEPLSLYPLATPKGEAIPYDVLRPIGVIKQAFDDATSAQVTIPAAAELLAFWATNDCIIAFNTNAVVPGNGAHLVGAFVLPGNTIMNIDHNGAAYFTVIGIRDPGGILFVTTVDKWKEIRKPIQYAVGY